MTQRRGREDQRRLVKAEIGGCDDSATLGAGCESAEETFGTGTGAGLATRIGPSLGFAIASRIGGLGT